MDTTNLTTLNVSSREALIHWSSEQTVYGRPATKDSDEFSLYLTQKDFRNFYRGFKIHHHSLSGCSANKDGRTIVARTLSAILRKIDRVGS